MKNYSADYPGKRIRIELDTLLESHKSALREKPENVTALTGLAETYITLWCYGFIAFKDALPEAEKAVLQALHLEDSFGEAHTILALVKMSQWDWAGCEIEFKRGIELSPDKANCHHWYALFLAAMGRLDESLSMTKSAAALDPSPGFMIGLGSIYYFAQDFDLLASCMEDLIANEPDYAPGYDWLGMAYVQQKCFDKSVEVYQKAVKLSDGLAEIQGGLGHAYGMAGRYEEGREVLETLRIQAIKYHIPPVQVAFIYAGLGNYDKMYEMLDKALDEKAWELIFINIEPWFEEFHDDPKFIKILNRLNFPKK